MPTTVWRDATLLLYKAANGLPTSSLRLGEIRVFYDVTEERVEILAIILKSEAAQWLAKHGKSEPESK